MGSVFFDQQALHDAAFGAGLVGDQRHAQDLFGERRAASSAVLRDLDAAALAASAGVNLRFDHDAAAELLGGRFGFVHGVRHFAARHGNAVSGQQGLGLVFVNFHGFAVLAFRNPNISCRFCRT